MAETERHFAWRTKYLFVCILASLRGIFLKFHNSHFSHMCYERCMFGCYRSIIKGTLLGKQSTILPCLGFNGRYFPENSYIEFSRHALRMVWVWSGFINNVGPFTSGPHYLSSAYRLPSAANRFSWKFLSPILCTCVRLSSVHRLACLWILGAYESHSYTCYTHLPNLVTSWHFCWRWN